MAVGLAAELKESMGVDADLIEGSKGIFDVCVGTQKIFSKYEEDRFPALGEISASITEVKICMKNG
jgi:hypothetical protein